MSHVTLTNSQSSGAGPFVEEIDTQMGSAVVGPDGILFFNAFDSSENNISGITTKGNTDSGSPPGTGGSNEFDVYLTNRITGSITTSDSSSHTIATLPITITNGAQIVDVSTIAYDVTQNIAASVRQIVSYRTTAGINALLNNVQAFTQEDLLFNFGVVNTDGSVPGIITINVTGNGDTIQWVTVATYVQVGS